MGSPLDLKTVMGGPLPAVEPADLKQVWTMLAAEKASTPPGETRGIERKLLGERCSPGCNVLAAFLRSTLIEAMLQHGLLDEWRTGGELQDKVFHFAAKFPFTGEPADFDDFLAAMKQ